MTPEGPKNSFEYDINRNQSNSSPEPPGRRTEFDPTRTDRAYKAARGVKNKDDRKRDRNRRRKERHESKGSGCVIF